MSAWRWVAADGMRPAGWWDGHPWRDPMPLAPHLQPAEVPKYLVLSADNQRTRAEPCHRCKGAVTEHVEGDAYCLCGWSGVVSDPATKPTTHPATEPAHNNFGANADW